jgi:hypothetical protein
MIYLFGQIIRILPLSGVFTRNNADLGKGEG